MIKSATEMELEKIFMSLSNLMSYEDTDASENIAEINNIKFKVLGVLTKIYDSRKD